MKKIYYKNLILFFSLTIILFMIIILVNYYGDGEYHFFRSSSFEYKLTDALLNQNKALICINYNDRNVKRLLLKQIPEQPKVLILGSSRTMSIGNNFFNNVHFFNASVHTANLEDHIAIYYLYHQRGWKPRKILIGLDPWIISKSNAETLWKITFLSEYREARKLFTTDKQDTINFYYQNISRFLEKNKELLSPYYLIDSLKNIKMLLKQDIKNRIIINPNTIQIDHFPSCHLHLPDGTYLTSITEESTSATQADYAGSVEIHRFSSTSLELSRKKMELFEQFIDYLSKQGIEIIFYLPPYEPMFYSKIKKNSNDQIFNVTENYFRSIAAQHHIKVMGSYNPFLFNLTSNDFIDDIHLKKQGIDKLFMRV
ncbi:MAG: hypothetical protein ACD_45C00485G0013 [uncultured bacterium]|nr:MAG: hypothetical protein ACD_45C00485G0013 [uncultured bacterium]